MKRTRRRLTTEQRLDALRFKQIVCRDGICVDCHSDCLQEWLEADHLVRKQTLRRYGYADKVWDPRNGQARCRPCHHLRTVGKRRLTRDEIPPEAWEFAAEIDMTWALERECETRAA